MVHAYSDRPISEESLHRILEAGRSTGSAQNRQEWTFYVVRDRQKLRELASTVYVPENIAGCQLAIGLASTGKRALDMGRLAQNMILAAWDEGIGSAPNGTQNAEGARRVLGLREEENLPVILSFGYPQHPHTPNPDDTAGILQRIKRKPLSDLVVWVD